MLGPAGFPLGEERGAWDGGKIWVGGDRLLPSIAVGEEREAAGSGGRREPGAQRGRRRPPVARLKGRRKIGRAHV